MPKTMLFLSAVTRMAAGIQFHPISLVNKLPFVSVSGVLKGMTLCADLVSE